MKQELESILKNKKIKPTAMRLLILKEIAENEKAMNFYELEERFDKAERSTIYRTLKVFEENSIIHSINDGSGAVKYALCNVNCSCKPEELHVHFFCMKCEITNCLKDIPIPEVKYPENYVIKTANYVLKGLCEKCQK